MEITVQLSRYWPKPVTRLLPVNLNDNATISDLIDLLPTEMLSRVEIDQYYKVSNRSFGWGSWNIEYVMSSGKVIWHPSYEEITVSDFFRTFGIADKSIVITTGLSGRGGGLGQEIWSYWPEILIGLQVFSSTKDLAEVARAISNRIKNWRKPKNPDMPTPVVENARGFLDILLRRDHWSSSELADLTGVSKETAIHFLRACGYRYDRHRTQFIASDETPRIVDMLNNVTWHQVRWDTLDPE